MKPLKIMLTLLKSIYFNFKVFPFETAIKLPVIVSYNTKLYNVYAGTITFECRPSFGMIKYGWYGGSKGVSGEMEPCKWSVDKKSRIVFKGPANFANGISIRCDNGGTIVFGRNFVCNSNCFFASNNCIKFGDNVLIGWHTNIRDVDGHKIYELNSQAAIVTNQSKEVVIGSHVWIGAHVDILKGVSIPDECIVAYRACVTGKFYDKNCIIGGFPAKVIKRNIKWEA
ncbi:acyltransferase [Peribacillus frigoritolerans]|uniref:acyltransferase n=1 Tax=Peribacillus frigoritolerans TaxID=450367 RepID=UPI002B254483|nr:acyltransferase [Peribacillus frigoritolerans]MEB2629680.1 acyltransferase [Peribacillus frigoritolerans]